MPEPRIDRERYVLGDPSKYVGLLDCERISERSHIHGWHVDSHYHEGLGQLFYFADGEIVGHLDFEDVVLEAPALVWMPPLVSHGFDYPENICGWVVTIPSVNLSMVSSSMPWILSWLPRQAYVSGEEHRAILSQLRSVFEEIEAEHGRWGEERETILEALLRVAFVQVHRSLKHTLFRETKTHFPQQALVNEFRALVDRDHSRYRSVHDYAAELSVTTTYLTRCVKAATGRTAGEIIHDRLLLQARRLIVFTDLPIAEIAYRLNFSSASYFTRFFTAAGGEGPSAFRNRMRTQQTG